MCGLVGIYTTDPSDNPDQRFSDAMKALDHRGPDDSGIERLQLADNRLLFGHKRLSIIDLSADGRQPMKSSNGQYTMTFNGEIYNYIELRNDLKGLGYSFLTATDSEVLLTAWQEWGVDCLNRLDGMFAFVIHDLKENTLHCVRDPFGIKPLYYYRSETHFCFASELRALEKISPNRPTLDKAHAIKYLNYGEYNPDSSTFYAEYKKVLPGTYLKISLNTDSPGYQEKKWFESDIQERKDLNFQQASEELRELFLQSVKRQLRSDVPLGAALSGGIDSSSIVSAIRYLEPDLPIHTFSYIAKDSPVNEEKWIDLVNRKGGLHSHKVYVTPDNFLEDLTDFITTQGEPLGGMSFYAEYCVYRLAKKNNITVMLDGHGADESIGGYDGYPEYRVRSLIEKREYLNAYNFIQEWKKWPGRTSSAAQNAIKYGIQHGLKINPKVVSLLKSFRGRDRLTEDLFLNVHPLPKPFEEPKDNYIRGRALAYRLQHEMCVRRCPPQLQGADRSAMRRSIENRVPFLSPPLVRFLLQMPEHFLISDTGRTKHLFRNSMKGIVPDEILERKDKIGYETPKDLRLRLSPNLKSKLDDSIELIKFLDRDTVYTILQDGDPSTIRLDSELPWRLFNLLQWVDLFDVDCSSTLVKN